MRILCGSARAEKYREECTSRLHKNILLHVHPCMQGATYDTEVVHLLDGPARRSRVLFASIIHTVLHAWPLHSLHSPELYQHWCGLGIMRDLIKIDGPPVRNWPRFGHFCDECEIIAYICFVALKAISVTRFVALDCPNI